MWTYDWSLPQLFTDTTNNPTLRLYSCLQRSARKLGMSHYTFTRKMKSEINATLRNDSNLVSNIPSGLVRDSFEQYLESIEDIWDSCYICHDCLWISFYLHPAWILTLSYHSSAFFYTTLKTRKLSDGQPIPWAQLYQTYFQSWMWMFI